MKWIQRKPQFKRESEGYQTQLQFTNTMSQCEGYWSIQNNSDVSGTSNTTTPQSKYFKRSSQQWIILPINNVQWFVIFNYEFHSINNEMFLFPLLRYSFNLEEFIHWCSVNEKSSSITWCGFMFPCRSNKPWCSNSTNQPS